MARLEPGSVMAFALPNGLWAACRVLREPDDDEAQFAGSVLVASTSWVGAREDALAAARERVRETVWCQGPPPPSFELAGVIALRGARAKNQHASAPWETFPEVAYAEWRSEHDLEGLARETEAARAHHAARVDELRRTVHVDLDGVVPLATPRTEREPADVLRGFLAAMARWEVECTRIQKDHPTEVFELADPAYAAIFAEFCTAPPPGPTNFASPPEHAAEVIVATITPRRQGAEPELRLTTEHSRYARSRRVYTLVQRDGVWLIDSRKPSW